ncbi:MAG: 2-keto-4-pentenoate hydratase [Betaproteobacteria bacterium RIFCSPLOWO2_12_FULL_63_13]|nr:MAG: 2-keto-4-pentenoate hydratase [Betaproteobacteria bacterium RIFCSPLOWO2_12_FULL_63_13]
MATSPQTIRQLAERLRKAEETGIAIEPLRDQLPAGDLAAAYAVQKVNTQYWLRKGRRLIGRKIGLTSKSVQKQLGVDQPDYGMLYADMVMCDGEEVALSRVMQPKVEAEVALVLDRDLKKKDISISELISAVAYAVPAIEIVGSRIANWNIKIQDTIADNASSGLFVLGNEPKRLEGLDLRLAGMVMERRGDQVSLGAGVACLGNPLNAALWLARTMVQVGAPLKAGDVIMSGALGPMATVAAGDVIEVRISGLGSVRTEFGA